MKQEIIVKASNLPHWGAPNYSGTPHYYLSLYDIPVSEPGEYVVTIEKKESSNESNI